MASWILHLRVAEDVLCVHPDLQLAPFAVGNIAPDPGIPDKKWEKFDLPTEVTHFPAMVSTGAVTISSSTGVISCPCASAWTRIRLRSGWDFLPLAAG